jgi:hypothetical protein
MTEDQIKRRARAELQKLIASISEYQLNVDFGEQFNLREDISKNYRIFKPMFYLYCLMSINFRPVKFSE